MPATSLSKKWFVDMPVAKKLRWLTLASGLLTLVVVGLSAATLISAGASWAVIAVPLAAGAFSLAFAYVLSRYVTDQVIQPFEDLASGMNMVAEGKFDIEIKHTEREDEIGQMSRALEKAKVASLALH